MNPDKQKAIYKRYREKNKILLRAKDKAYREKNKDKRRAQFKAWYEKNKEHNLNRKREHLANCQKCRESDQERSKQYHDAHLEEHKQHMKARHELLSKNPEWVSNERERLARFTQEHRKEVNARQRAWSDSHKDKKRQNNSEYRKQHPEQHAASEQRRRAHKKGTVVSLTTEQVRTMFESGCLFCGSHENLTIAHDTPVSKRGNTTRGNAFCACRSCNSRMGTKALKDVLVQQALPI